MANMRVEQKSNVKNSVSRMVFAGLSVLFQVLWFLLLVFRLNQYSTLISILSSVAALVITLLLFGMHANAEIKMTWIIIILAFPVFGLSLYFLFGRPGTSRRKRRDFERCAKLARAASEETNTAIFSLEKEDLVIANQCRYLQNYAGYPVYDNTDVKYYADTREALEAQKEALKTAEHFIFLEYFAIEQAEVFNGILDILTEKAKAGVEIRILYDDVGSVGFINPSFVKQMKQIGIECRVFNPMVPFLRMFMNHRDHRKITVVDGRIAFTGGYNLANEYFNLVQPYGHWKDAGIRVEGEAVTSFTTMFLEMWNGIKEYDVDYAKYYPKYSYQAKECSYVQPYADTPLDKERVGENAYLNIIKSAQEYVYIMTPYLIISGDMTRELVLAAKRGVDVRIVIPMIPDKKIVYQVTCSYLGLLAKNGIKIYKYTPGFCHAKLCIADSRAAIVGTINFDYRSLFHHFEDACFIFRSSAIDAIRNDFDETFPLCDNVTDNYKRRSTFLRIGQCILRFIAPLL